METNIILQGDSLEQLKTLPDESIDCVMTSPPYWNLRDYGTAIWEGGKKDCDHKIPETEKDPKNKNNSSHNVRFIKENCYKCNAKRIDKQLGLESTFKEYINNLCDIFDEVKRVLKKTGTCWVNLGDTYYGSSSYSNGGRSGFNQKDGNTIEWKRQFGDGKCLTCGKPCETQFCNRDCLNKQGNDFRSQNRLLPDKCLTLIPMRFAIEMVNRGWIMRNNIIWHKPNPIPHSVRDRFTVDFENLFLFSKNKKYYFEQQREKRKYDYDKSISYDLKGNPSYKNKVTKEDRNKIRDGGIKEGLKFDKAYNNPEGRNKRTVWKITTKSYKEAHFATYPEELCETPLKAGCPGFVCVKCGEPKEAIFEPSEEYAKNLRNQGKGWSSERRKEAIKVGNAMAEAKKHITSEYIHKGYKPNCECNEEFKGGIVLDPFFGSGTTGVVALKQQKKFIGIELNPEYIEIANKRLRPYLEQRKL